MYRGNRITVKDIAELAQCSEHLVRKLADMDIIYAHRDHNGWRVFQNPEETARKVKELVHGPITKELSPVTPPKPGHREMMAMP